MEKIADKPEEIKFKRILEIANVYSKENSDTLREELYDIVQWFINTKKTVDLYRFIKKNNLSEEFVDRILNMVHVYAYRPLLYVKLNGKVKTFVCIPVAIPLLIGMDKEGLSRFDFCIEHAIYEISENKIIKNLFSLNDDIILILDKYLYPGNTNEWVLAHHVKDYIKKLTYSNFKIIDYCIPLINPPFEISENIYSSTNIYKEKSQNIKKFFATIDVRFLVLIALVDINNQNSFNQAEDLFYIKKEEMKNEWLKKLENIILKHLYNKCNANRAALMIMKPTEFDKVPQVSFTTQRQIDLLCNTDVIKNMLKFQYLSVKPYINANIYWEEDNPLMLIEVEIRDELNHEILYFFNFSINLLIDKYELIAEILANISQELNISKVTFGKSNNLAEKFIC